MAGTKRADSLTWEENVNKILRDCRSSNNYEFKKWLSKKDGMGAPFFDSFYHKRLFNIHQAVNHQDSDHFIVVAGKEGCLTGDTIINVNRCSLGRRYRLDYIYEQYHNNQLAKDKLWNLKHQTFVRSFDGKTIRLHKMKDIIYSGIKEVFCLELVNGRKIKATADHKILTKNGWVELQNLTENDEVMCDTPDWYSSRWFYSKVKLIEHSGDEKTYDIICEEPHHNFVANGIVVHNCGKSTLAIQTATILDPTFNINRICFKMCDYIDRLRISKPGQVFILDEGNMFLFNREAYSDDNRFMVKLFALMRQRNLVTIICVPNFFTLDSYVRLHRVDTLVYIHKRGSYLGYVKSAIKVVSKEGQRTHRMAGFKLKDGTYWSGFYNKQIPSINNLDEDLYRKHKGDHFEDFLKEIHAIVRTREKDSEFLNLSAAIKILPLSRATYVTLLKDKELRGKKIGGKWYVERANLLEISSSEDSGGGILSSKGIESKSPVEKGGDCGAKKEKTTDPIAYFKEKSMPDDD